MVKVLYIVSRNKGQAGEHRRRKTWNSATSSSVKKWMGIQHPACIFTKHCSWALISAFLVPVFLNCHCIYHDPVLTSIHYIQMSLMDMGITYIYMSSHILLHVAELQIKRNKVQHFKNLSSDRVGCTSIRQAVQLLETKGLFIEVIINAAFFRQHKW